MEFATPLFELNIRGRSFFFAIPRVVSAHFETDYPKRRGPFMDWCRDGKCYQMWVGRCYLVADIAPPRGS
jgi:hypothetical protein